MSSIPFNIDSLSSHLFWDIDLNRFDVDRNKRLIVERIFMMGSKTEIRSIIQYYGLETIKKEIVKAGNLDEKTLNWVSHFFNIPKSKFKCYTRKRSVAVHWNF
jgi:hypothetical protein